MISKKLKEVALYYLNNLLKRPLQARAEENLMDWADTYAKDLFGMEMECKYDDDGDKRREIPRKIKALRAVLARHNIVDIACRGYDRNLDMIFDTFKIAPDGQAILRFMVYDDCMSVLGDLTVELSVIRRSGLNMRMLAALTGLTPLALEKTLALDGRLASKGILAMDEDSCKPSLSAPFRRMISYYFRHLSEDTIRRMMIGRAASATLSRDNFKYMATDYGHICTLLRNALKAGSSGVNILLYGIPGTGKTEMSKAIAAEIGAKLYMLSESVGNDRDGRLSELAFVQALLEGEKDAALLFDEAEDAFSHSPFVKNNNSKLYFNRMLEQNKTPVIWITNDIDRMDPAYIRRFKFALEVEKPDRAAREEIWKNISVKHRFRLPAKRIAALAKEYDVPPALIDTAIGSAKLIGSENAIEDTIEALHRAAYGSIPINNGNNKETPFVPELLNTDVDLGGLTIKLAAKEALRFSLCLYGASGTGKSAFARHLAEKLGIEVTHKRASDLMSSYVGETEQNIARAFKRARKDKSMLIFDEADSLLRDRKQASRSWEISQVNEMLTWMENHPYPFICTTNLMKDVDEASLRRFTFKVRFEYLKPAQVKLAFRRFFDIDISAPPLFGVDVSAPLPDLSYLTPGDFAVVKSKQELLEIADRDELIKLLGAEQSAKGIKSVKMGFA